MFKDSYKIILIKEGKFDLRQFSISPIHIISVILLVMLITSSFFLIFSDNFVHWTGSREIEKHRINNQKLVDTINENQQRMDSLLEDLNEIKRQDDLLRKLVKLPIIHDDIHKMGFGGSNNSSKNNDINYLLPDSSIDLDLINGTIDYLNRRINLELLSFKEITSKAKNNIDKILRYPAIYPVQNGKDRLSSNFGYRKDPFSRKYKFHDGHDYSAKIGTNVHSTANGRVKKSKYWGTFGNYIEVDHGNGYVTVYGHLSKRNVKIGDKVLRGQKIGEVGNTGRSTAPHLHYEVRYNNKALDPSSFYFDVPVN